MTTRIVFETATFADAIKKAERIAPSKGSAFDKAAGIVMEINPDTAAPVVVRATNTDIYSMEWVDVVECTGDPAVWRLPSKPLAQVCGSLPIGTGKNVTLEVIEKKNGHFQLQLSQGRIKTLFNMMDTESYPQWSPFDPDLCFPASDLGGRIAMVEWAAGKKEEPPLNGVHFDGEKVVATDRYRLATVTLPIPDLKEPLTVPAGLLGTILKQTGELAIGVDGEQLLIMPDQYTQIRTVTFGHPYPKVGRLMKRDYPQKISLNKTAFLEFLGRASNFSAGDRIPTLRIFIGRGEVAVAMKNEQVGMFGDVIEVPGEADHKRVELLFTPKNIMEPISFVPNEKFDLYYDPESPTKLVYVNGGSNYECWIMPRFDTSTPVGGA